MVGVVLLDCRRGNPLGNTKKLPEIASDVAPRARPPPKQRRPSPIALRKSAKGRFNQSRNFVVCSPLFGCQSGLFRRGFDPREMGGSKPPKELTV